MEKKTYGKPQMQVERFDDVIVASDGNGGDIDSTITEEPGGTIGGGPGYGGEGDGSDFG